MGRIRLTHLDGKLPNLALMKLAHWHRSQGDQVVLSRTAQPDLFDGSYDRVYGSAIFQWTQPETRVLQRTWPEAILGGTGSGRPADETVEATLDTDVYENYDYSIYPDYPFSIGFTQRGCRLSCGFCVVPQKEGRPRPLNTIHDIWRPNTRRCIVLLDNDFFGQPETDWKARIQEIQDGRFQVNFNQGINIRLITPEIAHALSTLRYYDDQFQVRRLHTAWDNLGQEKIFFKGMDILREAGIPPRHLMVYMLIGYRPDETMEDILYRFHRLKSAGCKPYPMVYNNRNKTLKAFQRWAIRRYDEVVSWEDYAPRGRKPDPYSAIGATQ